MSTHNHFRLLEQYQQYESVIHSLMESIMTSLNGLELLQSEPAQQQTINYLSRAYPFIELLYSLDGNGIQLTNSAYSPTMSERKRRSLGKGSDRSQRPYVQAARQSTNAVVVTSPYLSNATHQLAISVVQHLVDEQGRDRGYLVINFNLRRLISYLNGDEMRFRCHHYFQWIYGLIGGLLIVVAALLLYSALESLFSLFDEDNHVATGAFGIVILITLGMSIFDLGKTILEEEVLVNKDIHHHDSTRRTISRFMAAIIIAVSIEALLLMFKSLLDGGDVGNQLINAVWMLMAAVAMLAGLGVYLKLSRDSQPQTSDRISATNTPPG
ncbi:cache domain-containing protein [Zobellella sp. DQSA1]|uniref:cache domain-containing protein n=1 Tax=Zobellella sp. DQSA1 TaxID=3342386 RepID=UPI0035C0C298